LCPIFQWKRCNIILYDKDFFNIPDDEKTPDILDFRVINPEKIKKFTKHSSRRFFPKQPDSPFSQYFADVLNDVLSRYLDCEINWYVANHTTVSDEDKISNILEELDIRNENIAIYFFNGQPYSD